jgi:hypothetical protein
MQRLSRSAPSHIRHATALALICGMASAALGDTGLQWRLEASIQVRCAIVDLSVPADRPKELAIATMCNAQRYQLVIGKGTMQAGVISAKSSAGPVQISGNVVTIASTAPGPALTAIELTEPVSTERLSVTLQPI